MFSIVIPVFNHHDYTCACIESAFSCAFGADMEIIVVDNASDTPFKFRDVQTIRNKTNKGFPKAINQGIRASKGDTVVILNNDTIVTPRWLQRLEWHLNNGADVVGPMTNEISGPQRILIDSYSGQTEMWAAAENRYQEFKHKQGKTARVVGFCMAFKKAITDNIGLFDERFSPGNYEDDDFCLRAIDAGYKCAFALDTYIHHFGSVSFGEKARAYYDLL